MRGDKLGAEKRRLSSSPQDVVFLAEEQERLRIATELRDSTSQTIAALKMNLGVLKKLWEATATGTLATIEECLDLAGQCEQEVRILSHLLYPPLLEEFGLASSLRHYLTAVENRNGVKVRLTLKLPRRVRLPKAVEITLFRIVQECLSLVSLQETSSHVRIELYRQATHDEVRLEMKCGTRARRGKVSNLSGPDLHDGQGITIMQERVRRLGGELVLKTGDQGLAVRALMPITRLEA